jgi:hypothetical protein
MSQSKFTFGAICSFRVMVQIVTSLNHLQASFMIAIYLKYSIIMPSVVILNVANLSDVMLNVVMQFELGIAVMYNECAAI